MDLIEGHQEFVRPAPHFLQTPRRRDQMLEVISAGRVSL
jgi:hypothetical protein